MPEAAPPAASGRDAGGGPGGVVCLILAAGQGRRMGRPKACLPLGGTTGLARIARTCGQAGVPSLVVTGAHGPVVQAEAARLGLRAVHNPAWAAGRTGSVQAGWRAAGRTAVLVWPVDVPLPRPATVRELVRAAPAAPARPQVPTFRGRRGHPVLLPAPMRRQVLALAPDQPLRGVVRPAAEEVAVEDDGILLDLNTPLDHAAAVEWLRDGGAHAADLP